MRVFYRNNSGDGKGDKPTLDEIRTANIYELLTIVHNLTTNCEEQKHLEFNQFCVLNYLMQIVSNNINALSKDFTKSKFPKIDKLLFTKDGSWVANDRLSISHVINYKLFYDLNKEHLISAIKETFFENGFYTELCAIKDSDKIISSLIREPQSQGNFLEFSGIKEFFTIDIPLPTQQLSKHDKISEDALKTNIHYYFKLLHDIKQQNPQFFTKEGFKTLETQAFINSIYQVLGNSFKLLAQVSEYDLGDTLSRDIILMRNWLAHSEKLTYISFGRSSQDLGKSWLDIRLKLAKCITKPTMQNLEQKFILAKKLALQEKGKNPKKEKVERGDETKESAGKEGVKKPKEKAQDVSKIIKEFYDIPEEIPTIKKLAIQSYDISKSIIKELQSAYNSRRDLNEEEVTKIQELIKNPLFNPNIQVWCTHQKPLQKFADLVQQAGKTSEADQYKSNPIIERLTARENRHDSSHRPIDLLVEIAGEKALSLIEEMLYKGTSVVGRDREMLSLVEHAVLNNSTKPLQLILGSMSPEQKELMLDGTIKGVLENGVPISTSHFPPISLSLALAKEEHSIVLVQNDRDILKRVFQEATMVGFKLNILAQAFNKKAFKLVEALFGTPEFKSEVVEQDYCGGLDKDSLVGLFSKLSIFDLSSVDLKNIYSIYIKNRVDFTNISTLYEPHNLDNIKVLIKSLAEHSQDTSLDHRVSGFAYMQLIDIYSELAFIHEKMPEKNVEERKHYSKCDYIIEETNIIWQKVAEQRSVELENSVIISLSEYFKQQIGDGVKGQEKITKLFKVAPNFAAKLALTKVDQFFQIILDHVDCVTSKAIKQDLAMYIVENISILNKMDNSQIVKVIKLFDFEPKLMNPVTDKLLEGKPNFAATKDLVKYASKISDELKIKLKSYLEEQSRDESLGKLFAMLKLPNEPVSQEEQVVELLGTESTGVEE